MKILMLTWEYPPRIVGGIARVVCDLSKRLIKDGHEVTVITYKDGNMPYYEDDKGVEVYRVDNYIINPNNFIDWVMQLNFNMIAKANEIILKQGEFDVIHRHHTHAIYHHIPQASLTIMKEKNHDDYIVHRDDLKDVIMSFFS